VVASPPYWPRAKGKVERAVQYLKRSFLEGRSFTSLEDLNAQLRQWMSVTANVRVHGTTGGRPVDRLAADQEAMLPVAGTSAFPSTSVTERKADHDARISYQGVRYSVDPEILTGRRGEPVEVRLGTDGRIRIYHGAQLVGVHVLVPSGSPPQDDPLHAATRRKLRQEPTWTRPRGKTPQFEQVTEQSPSQLVEMAPEVAAHPLSAYEAA